MALAKLWKDGAVFAIEPIPSLFAKLSRRTRRFRNVNRFNLALSDNSGTGMMFVSTGAPDSSSSLWRPTGHMVDHPDVLFEQTVLVATLTIDDWATEHRVGTIDRLWLDLQGHELAI